jgi:hypothetical protein
MTWKAVKAQDAKLADESGRMITVVQQQAFLHEEPLSLTERQQGIRVVFEGSAMETDSGIPVCIVAGANAMALAELC